MIALFTFLLQTTTWPLSASTLYSVSTIVNEVNGSYEFTNGGATAVERIASSLDAVGAYLLPDQKKDGSGDEDMNQPT